MKLLLVEDDPKISHFLLKGLREDQHVVDLVETGPAGLDQAGGADYDAIVLDLMLPGLDGFAVCRALRGQDVATPVLVLSARDHVRDRVRALDCGADDYLVKPFAFEELLARLRALLRRAGGQGDPALCVGDLVIDPKRRHVSRGGRPVPLTMREYQILEFLARHAGAVVTRSALWEHVWETDAIPDSNVVEVYMRNLRNKLGRAPDLIRTVRGGGYVLETPCEPVA